ncbi:MAG TPA: S53 family peptidase [Trebonia sp.]
MAVWSMLSGIGLAAAMSGVVGVPALSPAPALPAGAGGTRPAALAPAAAPAPPTQAQCVKEYRGIYPRSTFPACYTPLQLQRAYDLPPLYALGFNGKGRTIVIADPFGSPTIRHDLGVFDQAFGLPAPPSFHIVQPAGKVPPYNPANAVMRAKAGETTLDVEVSHAMAPGASIVLAETPGTTAQGIATGAGYPQLMAAENYLVKHNVGDVISQSFSLPEQNFPAGDIQRLRQTYANADKHRVTVLAASNDNGVSGPTTTGIGYLQHRVVEWPASDPLVTGVGGVKFFLNAAGRPVAPVAAWNDTYAQASPVPWASNGGVSTMFGRPPYQDPVRGIVGNRRGVPDISLSAALSAGVLIYGSFPGNGFPFNGWIAGGGTSEATPEFAGIVAIADQFAGRRLGLLNPALYDLYQLHAPGIVDVTRGGNTVSFPVTGGLFTVRGYSARPGYDLVTGLGTVDAAQLVPGLAWASRSGRLPGAPR